MPLQNNKVLVTGTRSGLGKFMAEQFPGCFSLNRQNKKEVFEKALQIDLIIHSAFNTNRDADKYQMVKDNIFFTKELCELSTSPLFKKKFVFISSIDVYNSNKNDYNMMKEYAEAIVRETCQDYLILRCPALLGKNMRKNNFLKIIEDEEPKLSLTKNSSFNFVTHRDILNIIKYSYDNDIKGTFDVASSGNITLEQVAQMKSKKCNFGQFEYTTPSIDNQELVSIFNFMNKTSIETVNRFIEENYE
jgi:nucleoside-diphosphate-sugar epimerase